MVQVLITEWFKGQEPTIRAFKECDSTYMQGWFLANLHHHHLASGPPSKLSALLDNAKLVVYSLFPWLTCHWGCHFQFAEYIRRAFLETCDEQGYNNHIACTPCIGLSRIGRTYASIGATSFSVTKNNLTFVFFDRHVNILCASVRSLPFATMQCVWACPYTATPLPRPASRNDQLTIV